MRRILLLILLAFSQLTLNAQQYPYTLDGDGGFYQGASVRPFLKGDKVCSYIRSFNNNAHNSIVEIDVHSLNIDITLLDSTNAPIQGTGFGNFEIVNFGSGGRLFAFQEFNSGFLYNSQFSSGTGFLPIDTLPLPSNNTWLYSGYALNDSLFLLSGFTSNPSSFNLLLHNRDSSFAIIDTTMYSGLDVRKGVHLIHGTLEGFGDHSYWYRLNQDLSFDTIYGLNPLGGYVWYTGAAPYGNKTFMSGTFAKGLKEHHHIQLRKPNDDIAHYWYFPGYLGSIINQGYAYEPVQDVHYLAGQKEGNLMVTYNNDLYLTKATLDINQDTADITWDVWVGNQLFYQNLGIVYSNGHVFMLNAYQHPQQYHWIYEFRIYDANGFELSRIELHGLQPKVYPNPAKDKIHVQAHRNIISINVYNASGVLVSQHAVNQLEHQLDVSRLPAGAYILETQYDNGSTRQTILIE